MPNPLVTVIIPTYNRRQLVQRAVDSVLRQSIQDFEIVVVDDGGTDDTGAALAGTSRCRVIRTDHRGPAAARNAAVEVAVGRYIACLDSDDHWLENHLERLLAPMDRSEVGLVYSRTRTTRLDGSALAGRHDRRSCYAGQVVSRLFKHVFIHTSNTLCRADLLNASGGFDETLPVCEDYHLWLRMAMRSDVAHVPEVTAIRCWHDQALSRQNRVRNMVVRAVMLERFYLAEGGRAAVGYGAACQRLGRVFFQAGRAIGEAGQRADAMRFFNRSLRYQPMQIRSLAGYVDCWSRLNRNAPDESIQLILDRIGWSV